MKSIFKYIPLLAAALSLTACNFEQDDLFDASAAERLNEASAHFTKLFADSKGGWAMEYYPSEDKAGKLLMMTFNADGSVVTGMKNEDSDNEYITDKSCWQIITDLGPVLSFNTWNDIIHFYSNPENPTGKGQEGDYEFVITDAKEGADNFMVKGKKRGLYQRMTRLSEGTDFEAYLDEVENFKTKIFPEGCPNYLILETGNRLFEVEDMEYTSPDIWPYGEDKISTVSTYYYTLTKQPSDGKFHLRFNEDVTTDRDKSVRELVYNEDQDVFEDMENPEYVLRGPYAAAFMKDAIVNDSHNWTFARTADMSSDMKEAYDKLYTYFGTLKQGTKKYSLTQLDFSQKDDVFTLAVVFKVGTSASRSYYDFKMDFDGQKVTFAYDKPHDDGAQNMYNTMSAYLQPMFDIIGGTYDVKGAESNMVLKNIVLSSGSKYFTLKY